MREFLLVLTAMTFLCAVYFVTHTGCIFGPAVNVLISSGASTNMVVVQEKSSLKVQSKTPKQADHLAVVSSTYFMSSQR